MRLCFEPACGNRSDADFLCRCPTSGKHFLTKPLNVQRCCYRHHPSDESVQKWPYCLAPYFCGGGAGSVWHFHHTEAFSPVPRASTTPDRGSGHLWHRAHMVADRLKGVHQRAAESIWTPRFNQGWVPCAIKFQGWSIRLCSAWSLFYN